MSARNGDKARFNRQRKHKISQRVRNKELMKPAKQAKASSGAKQG